MGAIRFFGGLTLRLQQNTSLDRIHTAHSARDFECADSWIRLSGCLHHVSAE